MTRYAYFAIATSVLVLLLCLSGIFSVMGSNNSVYAQTGTSNENYGLIGSIQNDNQGHRAWIITGVWTMKLGNVSSGGNSNTSSQYNHVSDFNASLTMVMLNGSASHNHQISNFTQIGKAKFNSTMNTTTIRGNVTVTMRQGPVHSVPVHIIISQGKAIAIRLDSSKTNNHFGNTPIYGTVGLSESEAKQFAMLISNVTTGNESQMAQGVQNSNNSGMATSPSGTPLPPPYGS